MRSVTVFLIGVGSMVAACSPSSASGSPSSRSASGLSLPR